ncbi:adenylate cyclase type 2-like [Neocloeon triangulifer]|uniref:adenylate cyclase type 2-like n=1 Tax=Neocloeon triangulifer TaxID=2078957 RepID=UPI00286F9330|nr:adenylate cyclase type 2-like [Neocloeon triangulifer]
MGASTDFLDSTPGMELMTRSSLHSMRNPSQVSIFLRETLTQEVDERNWSWSNLRRQFRVKGLEELYVHYQRRLQHAYFAVFLLLQIICTCSQIAVVTSTTEASMVDVMTYSILLLLCLPLFFLACTERLMPTRGSSPWRPAFISAMVLAALLAADLGPVVYHYQDEEQLRLRPLYGAHVILACYIFLPAPTGSVAVGFGLFTMCAHVACMALVSYEPGHPRYVARIFGEVLFLLAVNGLGMYFRLVSEVILRRTFLDRRACMESTYKLNYEKEQEEQLMLSILPRHIATQVKDDIRSIFQQLQTYRNTPLRKKPFNQLYVQKHENVSILYADVVEFAKLTVTLPVNKLVETLNELFGRFDEASEEHNVLRIKFLGDCYYCVAGVPTPNPQHAKSCVELGLDMIAIIREVREERRLNIDMRIGIHTGNILSGLLGVCKWQFDVWSKDVMIANRMEQTGKPGKVHITEQTRRHLGNEYEYESGFGDQKDPLLAKYNIKTHLISPPERIVEMHQERVFIRQQHQSRRSSSLINKMHDQYKSGSLLVPRPSHSRSQMRRSTGGSDYINGNSSPVRRRTVFMDSNLYVYQQMLKRTDAHMADAIDKMPLRKVDQWFRAEKIHPLLLKFENFRWELPFLKQADPLFKFYLSCSLFLLLCMLGLQALAFPSAPLLSWIAFLIGSGFLLILAPSSWACYIWHRYRDPHNELDRTPPPENGVALALYQLAQKMAQSVSLRSSLYLMVTLTLAVCALSNTLVTCEDVQDETNSNLTDSKKYPQLRGNCEIPWHVTQACSLALLCALVFLRTHFLLKLLTNLALLSFYSWYVWTANAELYMDGASTNPNLDPRWSHIMMVSFLAFCVHFVDRQADYMNRLDFCWKRQLLEEQDEASTTRTVNKMLLRNILPNHVAEVYLDMNRPHDELFHEEYEYVAVMFASLAGYSLHDDEAGAEEDGLQDDGIGGLKLLNEIITDFDKLLFDSEFHRVEKIKVAGYTYMAACGLEPGRRDSAASYASSRSSNCSVQQTLDHTVVLTKFAARMMAVLKALNKDAFQTFNLRVGICHGKVMAGVVGEKKPLYDIWGDTVNMASRMDSTGLPGRIQILEQTATLLESQGVKCEARGMTYVKGKGDVQTYFVSVGSDLHLIPKEIAPRKNDELGMDDSDFEETSL